MRAIVAAAALALGCGLAWGESGYTIREVAVKKEPYDDAPTVGTLPEKTALEIGARRGGWLAVKSAAVGGWVRMLSVRIGSPVQPRPAAGGLTALFGAARLGAAGGGTVTTGVRGLDKEEIQAAQPNFAELQKLQEFGVSRDEARAFAAGNPSLASQRIDYLAAPGASSSDPQGTEATR